MKPRYYANLNYIGLRGETGELTKRFGEEYLNGNFKSLVIYLLDPNGDDLNKGYDHNKKSLVEKIKSDLSKVDKSEGAILYALGLSNKDNDKEFVTFENMVNEHNDKLILLKDKGEDKFVECRGLKMHLSVSPVPG